MLYMRKMEIRAVTIDGNYLLVSFEIGQLISYLVTNILKQSTLEAWQETYPRIYWYDSFLIFFSFLFFIHTFASYVRSRTHAHHLQAFSSQYVGM